MPIAVETSVFRLNDEQAYVPISTKLSPRALDWAQKHDRREAAFDFAVEVRAVPSGQSVAALRDTINVRLDQQRFAEVNRSSLVYQGGVVLAPGNYRLKLVARENESGKIGTFEENLTVPPRPPARISLSSVFSQASLCRLKNQRKRKRRARGFTRNWQPRRSKLRGEKIVPSVTRFFNQQQTLYVFFQAYYPEKPEKNQAFDPSTLRAGLIFFRGGMQVNMTPLIEPTQIDEKTHTASFRISLPLAKLPSGRYTVQAVVIAAGTQQSAFGRAYLALEQPPQAPTSAAPAAAPPAGSA